MSAHDGRVWPADVEAWRPAVEAWTGDLDLATGPDAWVPRTRNAFGTMRLWGPTTGVTLTIHPARGWIFPTHGPTEAVGPDDLDVFDVDDRPLYERARARLGPVGPDTAYGFVPALGAGGEPRLEALVIVAAVPHVVALAGCTGRRVFPDVTR